jgi:hypothetical protein
LSTAVFFPESIDQRNAELPLVHSFDMAARESFPQTWNAAKIL